MSSLVFDNTYKTMVPKKFLFKKALTSNLKLPFDPIKVKGVSVLWCSINKIPTSFLTTQLSFLEVMFLH